MGLNCSVGGARGMFEGRFATEVAGAIDQAFGAEGDWEAGEPRGYGEMAGDGWTDLRRRAVEELGRDELPNLLALGDEGRGVYLPAHVQAVTLPLSAGSLRCASLPGLRRELAELADRWGLPLHDGDLEEILGIGQDPDDGGVAELPEIQTFARLALAANEAVRRDCPLWLVG